MNNELSEIKSEELELFSDLVNRFRLKNRNHIFKIKFHFGKAIIFNFNILQISFVFFLYISIQDLSFKAA